MFTDRQTTHEPAKQISVHMTQLWNATLSPAHTFPPGVAGFMIVDLAK